MRPHIWGILIVIVIIVLIFNYSEMPRTTNLPMLSDP